MFFLPLHISPITRAGLLWLLLSAPVLLHAQDSTEIKVHFLYGSKPKKEFRKAERKWFGGMLGGHVGIEMDSGRIVNFIPQGKYHVFASKKDPHGRYALHAPRMFWQVLGNQAEEVKKATVIIPVSRRQYQQIDSLSQAYLDSTPYDYAFFGMRCAAATYDLLAFAGIMKPLGHAATWRRYFYPRKLRKRLFPLARQNGWPIIREEGTDHRKWEKDGRY
jgi:hypothetical protein